MDLCTDWLDTCSESTCWIPGAWVLTFLCVWSVINTLDFSGSDAAHTEPGTLFRDTKQVGCCSAHETGERQGWSARGGDIGFRMYKQGWKSLRHRTRLSGPSLTKRGQSGVGERSRGAEPGGGGVTARREELSSLLQREGARRDSAQVQGDLLPTLRSSVTAAYSETEGGNYRTCGGKQTMCPEKRECRGRGLRYVCHWYLFLSNWTYALRTPKHGSWLVALNDSHWVNAGSFLCDAEDPFSSCKIYSVNEKLSTEIAK